MKPAWTMRQLTRYTYRLAIAKRHYVIALSPLCSLLLSVSGTQIEVGDSFAAANPVVTHSALPTLPTPVQLAQVFNRDNSGNQVIVNGRRLNIPWLQWQDGITTRVLISDAGLVQGFGLELMNTEVSGQQPVQWFTPAVLPAWLSGPHRYLDVTPLIQQSGWQVTTAQSVLNITSPLVQVSGVRQGRQTWGDRIVVELNQPTPWQVSEQGSNLVVTLDGQANPAVLNAFKSASGNRLNGVKLTQTSPRTFTVTVQLKGGLSGGLRDDGVLRYRVWTLPNPNRLVIDLRPDSLPEKNVVWAPGVRWRQRYVPLGGQVFPMVWLEIDPRQTHISLRPIAPNAQSQVGTAPLLEIAARNQAAAAINGGFFNRNNQLPLGALRRENRWLSGPILNRGAIAWNDAGQFKLGRLILTEVLTTTTGVKYPILFLNSGYVQAGIARYTSDWGTTYTPITNNEILLAVRNGAIAARQQTGVAGTGQYPIPPDGYLLVFRGAATAANTLPIGTGVAMESFTTPTEFNQYPHILGAGPLLLQDRQIVLNGAAEGFSTAFNQQRASRSAIATTEQGILILAAVHNAPNSRGPSLAEMARLLQSIGAVDALNLDGGSSTSLSLGGQLLDRPPHSAARVHNGIGLFLQPISP